MLSLRKIKKTKAGDYRLWLLAGLIFAGLILFSGCGQEPAGTQPTEFEQQDIDLDLAAKLISWGENDNGLNCRVSADSIIAEKGGSIRLGWGGPFNRLIVKPNSISKDTYIQISTCFEKGNFHRRDHVVEFDFQPDGLVFDEPALLVLNARVVNALSTRSARDKTVKLYYYNPDNGEWEFDQEARIYRGKVVFRIDHFSKFGISRW